MGTLGETAGLDQTICSLREWLTPTQISKIELAAKSSRFSMEHYLSLNPEYVLEGADNGGFTPREQYLLSFSNS